MTRLIFYNVEYLEGLDGQKLNYLKFWKRISHPDGIEKKIARALKRLNPDVVAFAEVGGKNFVEGDYFSFIKKELCMEHQVKRVKYDLRGKLNILRKVPLLNQQSNAIMSKKELSKIETVYLHEGMKRTVIRVEVNLGKKVTLLLVHLALGETTRKAQIEELIGIVREINTPVILAGDFNTFNGEEEIEGLLRRAGLKHKFKMKGGRIFTYPTHHPRRRLDYVLTSQGIKVKNYEVLKMPFSDHLPVMIDFEVR
ncbi:MAG: endonuclease/exonuclease/phosphatase family protein [archaeon]